MSRSISVAELAVALTDGDELALIDGREQGAYSTSHLIYAVNVPRSRVELKAPALLPRRSTRVVVTDAGGGEADDVADTLAHLGYDDVSVLDGGNDAWAAAGHQLYSGVNVPSKLFGELVELHYETPHVSAPELHSWIDEGRRLVVLDSRTEPEFNRMSIPTGQSCPGGELVHRVFDLIDPDVTVVVNCAGRTRSILGAQSLRSAGVPNPVVALENGTMGWELAGLELDHGNTAVAPAPSPQGRAAARAAADEVAARLPIGTVDRSRALAWLAEPERTTYLLDVRTPAEYEAGHLAGSVSAPGGQLVQATDEYMATRGARIVVIDDDGTRATMSASWLLQMGWEVSVLAGVDQFDDVVTGPSQPVWSVDVLAAPAVEAAAVGDAMVVDLATSTEHRRSHIGGAVWAVRGRLAELTDEPGSRRVVLTSPDGTLAAFAHREAEALWPEADVVVLSGGTAAARAAGLTMESGLDYPGTPDDVWQLPYDPSDPSTLRQAMEGYLTWEVALVDQYERDPLVEFALA
ncbi:MAG: rhodanese-like domain-containing protein [Actinomycetota bacterium]|nr:rhodanese-like domain-containing protein [Actinomycetota bacterium]